MRKAGGFPINGKIDNKVVGITNYEDLNIYLHFEEINWNHDAEFVFRMSNLKITHT